MRFIWLAVSMAAFPVAWLWMPLEKWGTISGGLLFFLGLLVAAVVPIITVTANFIQPDHLTLVEAKRLTKALEKQQRFWVILLGTTLLTVVILVVSTFISPETSVLGHKLAPLFSGMIAMLFTALLFKVVDAIVGIRSLQTLRSELIIEAVKRIAAREREGISCFIDTPNVTPDGFGEIRNPPNSLD